MVVALEKMCIRDVPWPGRLQFQFVLSTCSLSESRRRVKLNGNFNEPGQPTIRLRATTQPQSGDAGASTGGLHLLRSKTPM